MRIKLTGEQVITGTGSTYSQGTVIVEDNEIDFVGNEEEVSSDDFDEEYELREYTIMPGIIDGHTHITYPGADPDKKADLVNNTPSERVVNTIKYARETVDSGVTTIRDLAGPLDIAMTIRDEISTGTIVGPRILTAGQGITTTSGHGNWVPWHIDTFLDSPGDTIGSKGIVADGRPEILKAVREQARRDTDVIKVWASGGVTDPDAGGIVAFSPTEIEALVNEANRHNLPVAAHAHNPPSIKACIDAGVTSIEHAMYMDDESIELMVENDIYLVPTISTMNKLTQRESAPEYMKQNAEKALAHQKSKLKKAIDRGVKLAMGTDAGASGLAHGDNLFELECMTDIGMDPLDVLEIATKHTADMLDIGDQVGVLQKGYSADIICVQGNPLKDIRILQDSNNIDMVLTEGEIVKNKLNNRS